jgi:hypothetical protein
MKEDFDEFCGSHKSVHVEIEDKFIGVGENGLPLGLADRTRLGKRR